MTYFLILRSPFAGRFCVGPFTTHATAQFWAESNGIDDWQMEAMWDPAEACGKAAGMTKKRTESRE